LNKYKVLFVCNRNVFVSPCAQAIFKQRCSAKGIIDYVELESCGLDVRREGDFSLPSLMKIAAYKNYSLSHRTRVFRDTDMYMFDIILTSDAGVFNRLSGKFNKEQDVSRIFPLVDFCLKTNPGAFKDIDSPTDEDCHKMIVNLEDAADGLLEYILTDMKYNPD